MVRRASQLFFPTLREDPADAESVSHKLLVRGAFIRQVGAGLWTFLPLGWRVHEKIVQIIREEMTQSARRSCSMPVLTPAELWKTTGRYEIPELFKLRDRNDREFVLPLTHEETVTFHARELQSYRDLPQMLYHFQTNDRDEPRPRRRESRTAGVRLQDAVSLATQRPSVDVITGTIKANFPTRIAFQVTSKIDSRTILGEMGAEQLLGQGDMLYMAGGRISRVHGPFASDEEVEKVVRHLKTQGTARIPRGRHRGRADRGGRRGVRRDRHGRGWRRRSVRASRCDRQTRPQGLDHLYSAPAAIGYNRAASLMERMELEGIVGQANHAGKREILVDEEGSV